MIQVEDGLTFLHLFTKILAGYHPKLNVDDELAHSTVEKIMISQSKESFSVVDERLCLDDVCSRFGHHVKFMVQSDQSNSQTCSEVPPRHL